MIDVEGGNAVLFVSPTGDSLLMDTGNVPPGAARDAGRIMAAIHDAGLKQIDHLIITHWHGDHFGGLAALAPQIPIREFIDHGANVQPGAAADEFTQKTYPQIIASENAKHTVAKPGDKIAMGGLDVVVVSSAGEIIKKPLPSGGKANPYCAEYKPADANAEDPMSVAIHVTYGKFRTVHPGRPYAKHGVQAGLPGGYAGHGGCAAGAAPRPGEQQHAGTRACAASARGHHE